MNKPVILLLLPLLLSAVFNIYGENPQNNYKDNYRDTKPFTSEADGFSIGWKLFVPENYNPDLKWPLIVNVLRTRTAHVDHSSWKLFRDAGYLMIITDNMPALSQKNAAKYYDAVKAAALKLQKEYSIDKDRVFTLGFSANGINAMNSPLLFPDVFTGAVCVGHLLTYPGMEKDTAEKYGRAIPYLVIVGKKDPNYSWMQFSWGNYKKMGHNLEHKVIDELGHQYRKKEVPIQLEWLEKAGGVASYRAELEQALVFEKQKEWKKAAALYKKIADSKKACSTVIEAQNRLKQAEEKSIKLEQARIAEEKKQKEKREQEAETILKNADKLAEQKEWDKARAAYLACIKKYNGTRAVQTAKEHAKAMLQDKEAVAYFKNKTLDTKCRSWLHMAQNYLNSGMKEEARELLEKIIRTHPDSEYAEQAKTALEKI